MTSEERRERRYRRRKEKREAKKLTGLHLTNPEEIFSLESIANGYRRVRKASPWKASTQAYGANRIINAGKDSEALLNGTWKSAGFVEFDIIERGKPRHIRSVKVAEKCIQATFCNECLVPLLSRYLIYDNGASMPGKGTDFALNRFKQQLRDHIKTYGVDGYIYLFDFSKYFDSIEHDRLVGMVRDKIPDERTMAIYEKIVREVKGGYGLGLGSQVSQISAVFYPSPVDHWVKDQMGIKGYGRYMDDGYIIHHDKEELEKLAAEFERRLIEHGITPNKNKCRIIRLTDHFIFLKQRFKVTKDGKITTRIGRDSVSKERRKIRKMRRLHDEGKKPYEEIVLEFFCWLCNLRRGKPFHIIVGMIRYFDRIFADKQGFYIPSKRNSRYIKMIRYAMKVARRGTVSEGIVLDTEDIKMLIAEKYGVSEKDVIKSQYSWVVKMPKEEPKE